MVCVLIDASTDTSVSGRKMAAGGSLGSANGIGRGASGKCRKGVCPLSISRKCDLGSRVLLNLLMYFRAHIEQLIAYVFTALIAPKLPSL